MKRLILMALSFGLVTTIASAQNTESNTNQSKQKQETKSKSKTEMNKDKDMKSKSESKSKTEMDQDKSKTESKSKQEKKSKSESMKDQSSRSGQMNWNKSADNTWKGVDNWHYRVNANGELEKSQDGQAWRLSQSGRWQDDQGNFYRIKDNKLESSKDGSSWAACPESTWKGSDNTIYRYSESEKSVYSSQSGKVDDDSNLDLNDQRKDAAPAPRGNDITIPDSIDNPQPLSVPVDSVNYREEERRERKYDNGQIMNMQDPSMRNYNMEVQDPMQQANRRGEALPNGAKNTYSDRRSPK